MPYTVQSADGNYYLEPLFSNNEDQWLTFDSDGAVFTIQSNRSIRAVKAIVHQTLRVWGVAYRKITYWYSSTYTRRFLVDVSAPIPVPHHYKVCLNGPSDVTPFEWSIDNPQDWLNTPRIEEFMRNCPVRKRTKILRSLADGTRVTKDWRCF